MSNQPPNARPPAHVPCSKCDFEADSRDRLWEHMASHLTPPYLPYECQLCAKKFTGELAIGLHFGKEHPTERVKVIIARDEALERRTTKDTDSIFRWLPDAKEETGSEQDSDPANPTFPAKTGHKPTEKETAEYMKRRNASPPVQRISASESKTQRDSPPPKAKLPPPHGYALFVREHKHDGSKEGLAAVGRAWRGLGDGQKVFNERAETMNRLYREEQEKQRPGKLNKDRDASATRAKRVEERGAPKTPLRPDKLNKDRDASATRAKRVEEGDSAKTPRRPAKLNAKCDASATRVKRVEEGDSPKTPRRPAKLNAKCDASATRVKRVEEGDSSKTPRRQAKLNEKCDASATRAKRVEKGDSSKTPRRPAKLNGKCDASATRAERVEEGGSSKTSRRPAKLNAKCDASATRAKTGKQ